MESLLRAVTAAVAQLEWRSAIDIFVVAIILYWLLTLIQGTTAMMLVRGIVTLLLVGTVLSNVLNLTVLSWLLRNSIPALIVAVPILFQPELRRALEQIGRAGGWLPHPSNLSSPAHIIDVIAVASRRLSERRWGALIVLERETPLGEFADTGVLIDGTLSVELLLNIFFPNSPLHDGAVIIRGDRLIAAGTVLPLSDIHGTAVHFGTRHRAALGITERTDALTIVVSEETGRISVGNGGRLSPSLDESKLRASLGTLYKPQTADQLPAWIRGRSIARAS
ncbi:MAG: diadenylate cyclase CdaA [Chloroflexota bacterium]